MLEIREMTERDIKEVAILEEETFPCPGQKRNNFFQIVQNGQIILIARTSLMGKGFPCSSHAFLSSLILLEK